MSNAIQDDPMADAEQPCFELEAMLAEIVKDELADRAARRILSQEDIQRLVEESRRRRQASATESPAS